MPVFDMLERRWITLSVFSQWGQRNEWHQDEIPQMLSTVRDELKAFFNVQTTDELKSICGWKGDLMESDLHDNP